MADLEADLRAVRAAMGGDALERDRLFEQVYGRILRYHRKLAGSPALAEELAQETIVRLIRSFGQLREAERFVPWAFRIATNVWRDYHRARAERDRAVAGEAAPGGDLAERRDLADRVVSALDKLPEIYRMALTLRYLEGMEYEAMAHVLDVPVVTLRSHIARGRNMIRRELEGEARP
jgi:RNA polymerase sigma-70 factor (ECF subfamily)